MRKDPRQPLTKESYEEKQSPQLFRKAKKPKNPVVEKNDLLKPPENEKIKKRFSRDEVIEKDFELRESQKIVIEQLVEVMTIQNTLLVEIKTILQDKFA